MGMSRTSAVQQWDIEELKKAFKWTEYFQQVFDLPMLHVFLVKSG